MKALAFALLLATAAPSLAQDTDPLKIDRRVGKLEGEMRAVQRKVFPGGDTKYFEPEIAPPVAAPPPTVGTPATTAISDLTQRVGELERQLQVLTGQIEANQFKVRQLEDGQAKLRGDIEFRLTTLEGGAKPVADPANPVISASKPGKIDTVAKPVAAAPAKPPTPEAAWKAAYANVTTKRWSDASAAMADFLAANPKSPRAPQAQYWIGRASAEQGQSAAAARAFLDGYKTYPRSERAPDSLIGLAGAMTSLKKPRDACRVLGELDSVYGDKLTSGQKDEAKAARAKAKCEA